MRAATPDALPDSMRGFVGVARAARRVGIVLLVAAAGAALVLSTVSYAWLTTRVDRFAVEGDAGITQDEFDHIVLRLRLAAAGLFVGALVLVGARRRLDDLLARVLRDWWGAARTAPHRGAALLRAQGLVFVASGAAVAAAAVALRIAFLDVPLRYDEATTYDNFVSDPLHVSLADYSTPNNHPLHTALAKLSVTLLGNGPTALRLPALLAGLLLVAATFALGWLLYGRWAALLAASFAATSSTLIEYSTNARGYTLVALFTAAGLVAAIRVLDGRGPGAWAAVAVCGALGAFAVPVMLYAYGGILVWIALSWLARGGDRRDLVRGLAGCAAATASLTALLYLPILVATGPTSLASNEFVDARTLPDFVEALPGHAADTAATWVRDLSAPVGAALGIVLAVSLVLTPKLSRFPVPPLAAFATWVLPVLVVQRVVPYTRVWLFALPLAMVAVSGLLGAALDRLGDRRRSLAGAAAATAVLLVGTTLVLSEDSVRTSRETGALLDAERVADTLREAIRPGDGVVATGSDAILQYYLERDGMDASVLYEDPGRGRRVFFVVNVLGGQTLAALLDASTLRPAGLPRLVERWPSAELYVVPITPNAS